METKAKPHIGFPACPSGETAATGVPAPRLDVSEAGEAGPCELDEG